MGDTAWPQELSFVQQELWSLVEIPALYQFHGCPSTLLLCWSGTLVGHASFAAGDWRILEPPGRLLGFSGPGQPTQGSSFPATLLFALPPAAEGVNLFRHHRRKWQ